jgi:uncharacterized RDD family membrane protein YckC
MNRVFLDTGYLIALEASDDQHHDEVAVSERKSDPELQFSGFWKRVGSALIDGVLLMIVSAIAGGMLGVLYALSTGMSQGAEFAGQMAGILASWLYFAGFESSSKQATPGKLALGMKVTDTSGERIRFGKATGRHFGKIVSAAILFIGHMMAGWTEKKQALHDKMAGCLVIDNPTA